MTRRRFKTPTLRKGASSRSSSDSAIAATGIRWRALVLVVAGVLVYANSLSGPFLFDDETAILRNPQIRELWPLSEPLSPPRDTPVAGRPVVNLSFAVNYAVGGLDVRGYHVVNVAIHLLAALTLFGIVRRTSAVAAAPHLSAGASAKADASLLRGGDRATDIAFAGALIWMLHPLQSEAVNYLTERTESLMALFYLLTLYCAIRRWHVAAVAACAVGMACKESMATAPLMVVLYDRVFVFDSFRAAFRARRGLYAGLAASWLVLAGLMASTPRTSVGFGGETTAWVYLLNQCQLIVRYLWLAVWPRALVLDYGLPRPLTLGDVWLQAVAVLALAVAALVALVRWPRAGFLAAWFFITLGPTSSIVPINTEVGAERRMYLPLAGLVTLAVIGHYRVSGSAARVVAGVLVCVLLAAGTFLRNREYASRLSIAQTVVDRWPSGRGHFLLGSELVEAGRREEALAHFRASARDYPGAHFALGTEFLADGMVDAAIVELEDFLRLLPSHPNSIAAHDLLGRAYLSKGQVEAALPHFEIVLTEPRYPFRDEVARYVESLKTLKNR